MMFEKILVGIDGSENSDRALKKAYEIRKKWDAKMVVFHSITHKMPDPIISTTTSYPTMMDYNMSQPIKINREMNTIEYNFPEEDYAKIKAAHQNQGSKIIDRAKQTLNFEEENIKYRLVTEDPEDYVIERADQEEFDLTVLGCKGDH